MVPRHCGNASGATATKFSFSTVYFRVIDNDKGGKPNFESMQVVLLGDKLKTVGPSVPLSMFFQKRFEIIPCKNHVWETCAFSTMSAHTIIILRWHLDTFTEVTLAYYTVSHRRSLHGT